MGTVADAPEAPQIHAPAIHEGDPDENWIKDLFSRADVTIDGAEPWDIHVHDRRIFRRIRAHGTLGLGESYMEGWWDCDDLEEMCFRCISTRLEEKLTPPARSLVGVAFSGLLHLHAQIKKDEDGEFRHHHLGVELENEFFAAMLDPAMQYSCAYFEGTGDLACAQRLKMDLICRKLGLKPGMSVLDIGCGWGGLAKYAAENFGCTVTGTTLSESQKSYAENMCSGLPVEIRLQGYREVSGLYDRIVSVGMLEHIDYHNYKKFMEVADRCQKPDGLFLCHTIAANTSHAAMDPWITRYIFPNSMLPSAAMVAEASEGHFVLEDVQNLGPHYSPTIREWERSFSKSSERFRLRFGGQFLRMWRLYLLSASAAFRARSLQVFQFLFSKAGSPGSQVSSAAYRDARIPNERACPWPPGPVEL